MVVPSGVRQEIYAWLGTFPRLEEWIGERTIQGFYAHSHVIKNRRFQSAFDLLASGFVECGYDKQPFFSSAHPSFEEKNQAITVSNMQDGTGPAWYLFDTTRPFRALIYQEREPYRITMLNRDGNHNAFYA